MERQMHASIRSDVYSASMGNATAAARLTNRQRIAMYDALIGRAEDRAVNAKTFEAHRQYLRLSMRLQERALRELGRGR